MRYLAIAIEDADADAFVNAVLHSPDVPAVAAIKQVTLNCASLDEAQVIS